MSRVGVEKADGIALITLKRPEARNALDDALDAELAAVWEDFAADPDCRVAVLRGEGKSFCAGVDLKTALPRWAGASFGDLRRNVATGIGGGLTRGRHRLYKPILAAIQGHAVGGGFELALACDIRIAAEDARFGVFEIRRGLHQGDGGLTRLVAIAGLGVALDLSLTGREVPAEEALRLGLVSRVVPRECLDRTALEMARLIAANPPAAVASVKETALELIGRPLDDALRLEALYGYSSIGSGEQLRMAPGMPTCRRAP